MAAKEQEEQWLTRHPLGDIDGIRKARIDPARRQPAIHLDIHFPDSIARLQNLVNLDNPTALLNVDEGLAFLELQRRWNSSTLVP